jgi:hypothetical protein
VRGGAVLTSKNQNQSGGFMRSILQHTSACALMACASANAGVTSSGTQAPAVFSVQTTPALRELGGSLEGVACVSTNDVWSVGNAIVHFNGTTWEKAASLPAGGALTDVSSLSARNVWAAGTLGSAPLAEHWDGKSWTQVPTASLSDTAAFNSILALSANDVWAGGQVVIPNVAIEPLFEHWNGQLWTVVSGPAESAFIRKLAGTGPTDIWAVGYSTSATAKPVIEHFNGKQWTHVPAPFPGLGGELLGVVALSPSNAWAVGFATLAPVGNKQQFLGSPVQTLIEHWDGNSWQVVPSPNIGTPSVFQRNELYAVAALSPTDIWTAGQFQLPDGSGSQITLALHWDGTVWSIAAVPNVGLAGGLRGVAVAQPSTVILVGAGAFGGMLPDLSPLIATRDGG